MNATIAVHAGHTGSQSAGLALALDPSVAFALEPEDTTPRYCRLAHPTGDACAATLAALEGAESCLLTNAGMAAISAVLLALLRPGDHVIAPDSLYAATHGLLTRHLSEWGIEATFVDPRDPAHFVAAQRPNTRLVWLESPSNPLLRLTDLTAVAAWARERGVITIADNTFASPLGSQPLRDGVDIVVHSATKYLSGHGDLLAGAILTRETLAARIRPWVSILGVGLSAQGAWLLHRGLATLALRFERHCRSALAIATALELHPAVAAVYYPGLASHPQSDLAQRQLPRGAGGVLSIALRPGWDALTVLHRTRLAAPALSLGEPRTLICHPASMLYGALAPCERQRLGITDNLLRLAVGLEEPDDILSDVMEALG